MTRLVVAFRNFANAPKNYQLKCGFQNPQSVKKKRWIFTFTYTHLQMYDQDENLYLLKIHMHIWDFTMGTVQMIVVFWILTPRTKNSLTNTMTENGVPFKSSGVTMTTNRTALSFLNIS